MCWTPEMQERANPAKHPGAYILSGETHIHQMATKLNVCLHAVIFDKEMCSEIAQEEVLK